MKKILFALAAILGFVACDSNEPAPIVEQTLQLSVDNTEIYANGTQAVTFTVKDDNGAAVEGATIYFADTNEALSGNTFTTRYAGEYKFYAKKGNAKSNEVTVKAKVVEDDTKIITLTADSDNYALGTTAQFTVDCNGDDVTADATIYIVESDDQYVALEDNTFAAQESGYYTFFAEYDGEKSNNLVIMFAQTDTLPIVLVVEPATIVADGVDKATFSLTQGETTVQDFELYNATDNSLVESKEFSTTVAGVYSFYAMYEGETSNTVELTASMQTVEEKPIEIEASATTIKANGVDYTKFTVMQDGANVTDSSTIYINGGQLNGNRFVTTSPGIYTVYAVKGEQKSNELTITAEEVIASGKTIVFADGVTLTSGWYDVNKYKQGDNGDIQMCWAASASNIIQWWQDRYVAQGGTLPSTAINGPSTKTYSTGCQYQLALMDMFHSEWDNSLGGHVDQAIPWYFEGKLNGGEYASPGSQAVPLSGGGYWKSIWTSSVLPNIYCDYDSQVGYAVSYDNYYIWGNGTDLTNTDRLKKFTELVVQSFEHGMASLTVALAANLASIHHATTLWGYEIDNATGLLTRVWLTDSDDMTTEPKTAILHEYTVSIDGDRANIKLSSSEVRYGNVWVVSLVPISGPNM